MLCPLLTQILSQPSQAVALAHHNTYTPWPNASLAHPSNSPRFSEGINSHEHIARLNIIKRKSTRHCSVCYTRIGTELITGIIHVQDVVDYGSGLPG